MKELLQKVKKALMSRLGKGISWTMVSMGIMAVSGIAYNYIIGATYGIATLGLFNGAMNYYVAIAQLAVFGIHFSTLKYISEFHEDEEKTATVIGSAVFSTAIMALGVSLASYGILWGVGQFISHELVTYVRNIIPALFFFALNKVLLNHLNGLSRMKAYAFFQSLRNILIITAIVLLIIFKAPGRMLVYCFIVSESVLFICILIYAIKGGKIKFRLDRWWIMEHFRYGFRIMPGNLVLELNARMDVMILGWFTSSHIVGIYSFALKFAEGFYQLLIVVRRNINPMIAQLLAKRDLSGYDKLKSNLERYTKYLVPLSAGMIMVGFVVISYVFAGEEGKSYITALGPMFIVMLSITFNSTSVIFGNTLNQAGFPTNEARLNIATLLTNIGLNILLIPYLGMYGAAIGTAVSYMVFSWMLRSGIRRKIMA